MTTRLFSFSLLLVLSCAASSYAQDFRQLLKDMRERYHGATSLHITMDIRVFENSISSKPFYEDRAEIMKSDENYSYHLRNTELLMNSRYLIVVSKEEKQVICIRSDSKDRSAYQKKFNINIDSMLNLFVSPVFLGNEKGVDHYQILQQDNEVRQIDFYINSEKKFFQRLEYRYVRGQMALINFEKFETEIQFPGDTFDEGRYLVVVDGKQRLTKAFSGYELIEQSEN